MQLLAVAAGAGPESDWRPERAVRRTPTSLRARGKSGAGSAARCKAQPGRPPPTARLRELGEQPAVPKRGGAAPLTSVADDEEVEGGGAEAQGCPTAHHDGAAGVRIRSPRGEVQGSLRAGPCKRRTAAAAAVGRGRARTGADGRGGTRYRPDALPPPAAPRRVPRRRRARVRVRVWREGQEEPRPPRGFPQPLPAARSRGAALPAARAPRRLLGRGCARRRRRGTFRFGCVRGF